MLLSLRDFQDDKADVIQKYSSDEARNLKAYGELPENAKINETDLNGPEDECVYRSLFELGAHESSVRAATAWWTLGLAATTTMRPTTRSISTISVRAGFPHQPSIISHF